MNEELVKELLNLPKLIKEKQRDILELQKQIRLVEYKKKEIENEITLAVFEERDSQGKPRFSNIAIRKAEIARRLKRDKKYQELLEYERELMTRLNEEKIELEYLQNRFSGIKYYVRYISSLTDQS